MNIHTDTRPDAAAAATRRSSAPDRADRNAPGESPAPAATDTVEISAEARAAVQAKAAEQARADAPYTENDLAPLKTRFSKLLRKESSIYERIATFMQKGMFKRSINDQLKIEIDADGKAVVGGITDVKAARALEKAINGDKKLLNDIVAYQTEEKSLSEEIRRVTGTSLKTYDARVESFQKERGKEQPSGAPAEPASTEPAETLGDQTLHAVDPEFTAMISDHYAMGSAAMDISGMNNILEDAEGTVNKMMSKVTGNINQAFYDMNKGIRMGAGGAPDPTQYLEDSLVDLTRLKISVDNTGNLTIEGTASKNNRETDKAAKEIITKMFEEELKANPVTGEQHDFKIAASYLLNTYDETFGEGNPLGLGADARTLETVYDHGNIESHVSSPEREAELAAEIDKSAKDALKNMGVDAKDLVIEMNDEGKLVASNLNPNDPRAAGVQKALEALNLQLKDRSIEDVRGNAATLSADPVKRLKGLMSNMDVLRPGGAGLLKRS
jgi:hypothetical protein